MVRGVYYDILNGGRVLYKDSDDHLIAFFSGVTEEIIYWGKATGTTLTESRIKNELTREVGPVGLPSGKTYVFPNTTTAKFFYWCIPLNPTGVGSGARVIDYVKNPDSTTLTGMAGTGTYSNLQTNPSPSIQAIRYAIVSVDGVQYRVYRSANTYGTSTFNTQKVYSIVE